jgi:hypothetical protein
MRRFVGCAIAIAIGSIACGHASTRSDAEPIDGSGDGGVTCASPRWRLQYSAPTSATWTEGGGVLLAVEPGAKVEEPLAMEQIAADGSALMLDGPFSAAFAYDSIALGTEDYGLGVWLAGPLEVPPVDEISGAQVLISSQGSDRARIQAIASGRSGMRPATDRKSTTSAATSGTLSIVRDASGLLTVSVMDALGGTLTSTADTSRVGTTGMSARLGLSLVALRTGVASTSTKATKLRIRRLVVDGGGGAIKSDDFACENAVAMSF